LVLTAHGFNVIVILILLQLDFMSELHFLAVKTSKDYS